MGSAASLQDTALTLGGLLFLLGGSSRFSKSATGLMPRSRLRLRKPVERRGRLLPRLKLPMRRSRFCNPL
jgi:hypothetical protein